MKKNFFISAALVLLLNIFALRVIAQNAEGEINYSALIVSDMMPDMSANPFPLITMKFKDDKEVISMNKLPMMGGAALPIEKAIYDFKTQQVDLLLNKDGKKYDVSATQQEMTDAMKNKAAGASSGIPGMGSMLNPDSLKVNFVLTDSIVKVMGYTCHKYTGSNSLMKTELYASDADDLPQKMANSLSNMMNSIGMGGGYEGIKGFIVKIVVHANIMGMDVEIVIEANKISFKKIPDSEFEIPKDYNKVTFKDYQKIMQGNYIEK